MTKRNNWNLVGGFLVLVSGLATAQEVAPLIRERAPAVSVTVTTKDGSKQSDGLVTPTPIPTPTPDPEKVIVAIVNSHSITKAQLDRRVAAVMGSKGPRITAEDLIGPIPVQRPGATLSAGSRKNPALVIDENDPGVILERKLMAEQQKMETEEAIRRAEEELVFEWVDQMLLADEARRQGFLISDRELQDRMRELESEFKLRSDRVSSLLDAFGMSKGEFESYVYDALLIEKLLDRYVQLNISEEMLQQAYKLNPDNFIEPPKYNIAHFVVTLSEADTQKFREGYKKIADKVRTRLEKGEKPEEVFDEVNDLELGIFGSVYTTDIDSRMMDPDVRKTLLSMKPGQTSKILEISEAIDGKRVPLAYHVIKVIQFTPETGRTFEEAVPKLRRASAELARQDVLGLIRQAKSHRVITNFSGIPASKIPTAAELRQEHAAISLKAR